MTREKVLVVEDDMRVADIISRALKVFGHEYLLVTSVESALEMAELDDFSVILTDLGLPLRGNQPQKIKPFGGFELAENIRGMIPGIRVVFCTGKDFASVQEMMPVEFSPVSFLQKPFPLDRLRRVISPRKKAAIVSAAVLEEEAEAILKLEKEGYVIHVAFDEGIKTLRGQLIPLFDEILVRI